MMYFQALIHKDQDSSFGVSFPDVEGCFSAGETMEEAVANASEALQLYFEDQAEIPEPRKMDELVNLPEIKAELAAGAVLVAVPYMWLSGKQVRVNVSLDTAMLSAIDQAAKAHGLNRSAYLVSAAQAAMNFKPAERH
ncbi:type II toxin-antitoxin system HicB family antitoxin [Pseudovibrio sp. Tun.PSC04-5.I4]|uniref:type II toxin-antitoxin system HicB family antitoxin n=1 Tax=Pseudovibrio sp. Tun.PSC04-5.I4 TaxID=1798213 RepID=UPI0008896DDB|nr:type II toxin-antitoxin system HicB family antitoxin [Pseudovibrio sp. Tun.PSC04-5.I4]SDR45421.1 Predicted nuclease of the RNAse H fold, HicB family [Pseudovibrio sp. Tun.PSC04-5.I4]